MHRKILLNKQETLEECFGERKKERDIERDNICETNHYL